MPRMTTVMRLLSRGMQKYASASIPKQRASPAWQTARTEDRKGPGVCLAKERTPCLNSAVLFLIQSAECQSSVPFFFVSGSVAIIAHMGRCPPLAEACGWMQTAAGSGSLGPLGPACHGTEPNRAHGNQPQRLRLKAQSRVLDKGLRPFQSTSWVGGGARGRG